MPKQRRHYQSGGDVEDVGPLSQLDPASAFLGIMAQQYTTSPEAHERASRYLDDYESELDMAPERELLGKMRSSSEEVREALREARKRLLEQKYNPGETFLAAAQGFGAPTRTGSFGETMGNVAGAIREPLAKRNEFERNRDSQLLDIDSAIAQAEMPVDQAELQLEQLRRQLQNRLAVEAMETLSKPVTGGRNPWANIRPDAIRALDRAYAPQFAEWVQGGAATGAQAINQLKFAQDVLERGDDALTGPYIGAVSSLPGVGSWLQAYATPEGADVRDLVEQVIQQDIRAVLGAQFTEREGTMLLRRTYNPSLEEWRNARRLGWLIDRLESTYQNKAALARHYREHGTTAGFEGPLSYDIQDFIPPEDIDETSETTTDEPPEWVTGEDLELWEVYTPEERERLQQLYDQMNQGAAP